MAESGSSHRTWPGSWTQCRTGLSLASQRDIYTEKGKKLTCWATRFLSAWILVSLWVTHQRSLFLWFHLQLSILLCGASSHMEFLLAGRKAVPGHAIPVDHWHSRFLSARLVKPVLPSVGDNAGCPCLSSVSVSIELSAPPRSSGNLPYPPPPGCTLLPHSNGSACGWGAVVLLCSLSAWDRNNQELLWQFPLARPPLLFSWLHWWDE